MSLLLHPVLLLVDIPFHMLRKRLSIFQTPYDMNHIQFSKFFSFSLFLLRFRFVSVFLSLFPRRIIIRAYRPLNFKTQQAAEYVPPVEIHLSLDLCLFVVQWVAIVIPHSYFVFNGVNRQCYQRIIL